MSTLAQRMSDDVQNRIFAQNLVSRLRFLNQDSGINITQALWVHHRLRALNVYFAGETYIIDLLNMVVTGDLETACIALQHATPDSMTESYHWLSQEKLDFLVNEIKNHLGWP